MRWSLWRRHACRVALEASTPDLPLMQRSPSRPQCYVATARRRSLTQALFAVEAGLECALRTSLIVLRFGGHHQYAAYLAPPGWAHNVYAFAKYSRSTSSILSISSVLL